MIRVESLCLSCGDRRILDGLSFTVARGETLAVIGESGAGKTSLARLLMGLLPGGPATIPRSRPGFRWSGQALVDELDVLRAKQRELRRFRGRRAGMISQALADALNPHLTVRQHLREVMSLHRLPGTVEEVCAAWNIPVRLCDRYPAGLSGGEIQRVLTALAMLPRPPVLILDEPTASLDRANRARAVAAFTRERQFRCQLLITHDHDLARQLADRIAVLRAGRIREIGAAQDILPPPVRRPCPAACRDVCPDTGNPCARPGLHVHGLSHSFSGIPVLRDLSFHIPMGRCLAITGESGSGKSTLARILAGLEPLQAGQICWVSEKGAPQTGLSPRRGAMVSQHPHRALARHFSVAQVLAEALRLGGQRATSQVGALSARGLLETVGLPVSTAFLMQRTATLSGGEAQRLVIARALAAQPDFLIADEPTAALDRVAHNRVLRLLRRLQQRRRLTVLLVTHDSEVVAMLADRSMHLAAIQCQDRSQLR